MSMKSEWTNRVQTIPKMEINKNELKKKLSK